MGLSYPQQGYPQYIRNNKVSPQQGYQQHGYPKSMLACCHQDTWVRTFASSSTAVLGFLSSVTLLPNQYHHHQPASYR
jgi:hypothetical protein